MPYTQKRASLALAVLAVTSLMSPTTAQAAPCDVSPTELPVNTYTSKFQGDPAVAMDGDGDFVVAWVSDGQDGDGRGIFARRYDRAGVAQGPEFQVNTFTRSWQTNPSIAMDADGDFVVAWTVANVVVNSKSQGRIRQNRDLFGVYAQRFDAAGIAQGPEFRINTETVDEQSRPAVAMDADGDFVVAWESWGQDGSELGVFAQRYNAAGVRQGSEFQVNTYSTGDQFFPAIAMDAEGDFVVVWWSREQDDGTSGIYAQRYGAAGVAQGSEFQVNTYTMNDQTAPSVAMDADGDFVVAWESRGQDGSFDGVFAQRYDAAGVPQASEFQVNTQTINSQSIPSVAMDGDGAFVVAWNSWDQDGDGSGIYAQRYDAAGLDQGPEFQVNLYTTSLQWFPTVAMDGDANFLVAWQSRGQDSSGEGVFARHFWVSPPKVAAGQASISDDWRSLPDSTTFADAIVIAGPPTLHGGDPGVVRLREASGGGFEASFQEWAYLDSVHTEEDLSYLVVERGRHVMADGSIWEAGSFPLGGTGRFQVESFSAPFAARPALFLTIQTYNGDQPVTVRARRVTVNGFEAALFEEEALMDGHLDEEVGYLAVYSPAGSGKIQVGPTSMPYLLQWPLVDRRFVPVLGSALKLEEEQSQDPERNHFDETLSVLDLGGLIFAQDITSAGRDTVALRRLDPEDTAPMEWGMVARVTDDWSTVPLCRQYQNPVVVAKPVSAQGQDPGVVRLRNVTGDSFEMRYQEWLYLNRRHIKERVFYMVVEAGTTSIAGLDVEAGKLTSNLVQADGFETVGFTQSFADAPAVFTGVMTAEGPDPVTTRVDGLSAMEFSVTMAEEEAKTDGHRKTETLGWIAIERGSGTTTDGRDVAVGQNTADDQPSTTALGLTADRRFPVLLGDVVTTNETDPVFLRYQNLTPSSVELFLQEEQSLDDETAHIAEDVSIFAAE